VFRQKGFVGGYHMFPVTKGLQYKALGRFISAYRFHHYRDVRVFEDFTRVSREQRRINLHPSVGYDIHIRYSLEANGQAYARFQNVPILLKDLYDSGTHSAESYQSDGDFTHKLSS
jgi:hypothetical protein